MRPFSQKELDKRNKYAARIQLASATPPHLAVYLNV
jgi:hypothetical protein